MSKQGLQPESGPQRRRTLYLILGLALVLRTYHLAYPPWDYYASRQTFNLMVVRDFLRRGPHLLSPQVQWLVADSPTRPSYFLGEFPLIHTLAAALLWIFPWGDWLARFIVIAFSLAGTYWLYSLTSRGLGTVAGYFAALAWAVMPFSVFFGRTFMSDLPALSLSIGAVDFFDRWLETRRPFLLYATEALGIVTLLTKPTVIGFGLPLAFLAIVRFRGEIRKMVHLPVGAVAMLTPMTLWLVHIWHLSQLGGPAVIERGVVGKSLGLWLRASTWSEQFDRLWRLGLGPAGFVLVLVGLVWPWRGAKSYLFHIWWLGSTAVLFLIPLAFVGWNEYYLLPLVAPAAGLIGRGLAGLSALKGMRYPAFALALVFVAISIRSAKPLFQSDGLHYRLGSLLNRLTRPGDLLLTSGGDAADLLYFSGRRGWEKRTYSPEVVERLVLAGARVYATGDPSATQANASLAPYLDQHFLRLSQDDLQGGSKDWMLWSLEPPPEPARRIAEDEIQNPYPVNYNQEIEMLGNSVREVLRWPAAFEVAYYWHCLSKIKSSLRVFVHVTTPEGRTVFQQDHWPLAGHLPTTRWNVGDILRERYVLVLPGNLPEGRYQLRVGWFDPARGPRLPIVAPSTSDGEARAIIAEFDVHRAPRYRWFTVDY